MINQIPNKPLGRVIQHDLVHELLTYGAGSNEPILGLRGNWSCGHDFRINRGILTWLVMRALQVERLPWMTDQIFTEIPFTTVDLHGVLQKLKDTSLVEGACEEIREIYRCTQEWYAQQDVPTLRLGRGFRNEEFNGQPGNYATAVLRKAQAARMLGKSHIAIPVDVLSSWGRSAKYSDCVAGISLDIHAADVLCCAETLAPRPGAIGWNAMESGEWIVIHRAVDGILKVPVDNVVALKDFAVKPVARGEAQHVYDQEMQVMRRHSHLYRWEQPQPTSKQPMRYRFAKLVQATRNLFSQGWE